MTRTKKQSGIKMTLRFLLSVIVIFGIVVPLSVSAQPRKSNGNHWPDGVSVLYFSYNDNDFTSAELLEIQQAFAIWNSANSMSDATTLGVHKKYMYVTAGESDNEIRRPISWQYSNSYTAYCEPHYINEATGELDYVHILLNDNKNFSTTVQSDHYHLRSVVAHEAGHALGVAHCHEYGETCRSSTCTSNVMNRDLDTEQVRITLQPYDYSSYFIANQ